MFTIIVLPARGKLGKTAVLWSTLESDEFSLRGEQCEVWWNMGIQFALDSGQVQSEISLSQLVTHNTVYLKGLFEKNPKMNLVVIVPKVFSRKIFLNLAISSSGFSWKTELWPWLWLVMDGYLIGESGIGRSLLRFELIRETRIRSSNKTTNSRTHHI